MRGRVQEERLGNLHYESDGVGAGALAPCAGLA